MKKLLTLLVVCIGLSTFAQSRTEMRERIKAQKVAFITEKLSLTTSEAEKFWPLYNAFEVTENNIRRNDFRVIKQAMRKNPDMPEAEANKFLEQLITAEEKMHKAKVKLITDLKGVISSKKIIKLKRAEDEFNRELLKKLKDLRSKRSQNKD